MKNLQIRGQIDRILMILVFIAAAGSSRAQSGGDSSLRVKKLMEKIKQAYQQARYLDFRISYYYSNAERPDELLDSLSGEMEIDRGHSRIELGGMQTIITGKYAIQIVDDEKIMYVASAVRAAGVSGFDRSVSAGAAPGAAGAGNPLGMLDSIFTHIGGVRTAVDRQGGQDVMTLVFPDGQPYSRLEIRVDAKNGFFQRVIYWLNTASLVGQQMLGTPDDPSPYGPHGRMDIVFSDYRRGKFDDGLFREENFFNKIAAGRFEPSGHYKDYHIFLASSNL